MIELAKEDQVIRFPKPKIQATAFGGIFKLPPIKNEGSPGSGTLTNEQFKLLCKCERENNEPTNA